MGLWPAVKPESGRYVLTRAFFFGESVRVPIYRLRTPASRGKLNVRYADVMPDSAEIIGGQH